ncbi:hypothetical protein DFH09DRAFT_1078754 [Mycena vulgaris]|nr:hypothetical protein DFH09DRAFT_1078754 [Mycena vulgaris]
MDNSSKCHIVYTRSSVCGGHHPVPKPLYSPQAISFGSVRVNTLDYPPLANATEYTVAPASRPPSVNADRPTYSSVSRPLKSPVNSLDGYSFDLPLLRPVSPDVSDGELSTPEYSCGGWTPVSQRTSHTHRERCSGSNRSLRTSGSVRTASNENQSDPESGSESTLACATSNMSRDELRALSYRHGQIAKQFRLLEERRAIAERNQQDWVVVINDSPVNDSAGPILEPHSKSPKERGRSSSKKTPAIMADAVPVAPEAEANKPAWARDRVERAPVAKVQFTEAEPKESEASPAASNIEPVADKSKSGRSV